MKIRCATPTQHHSLFLSNPILPVCCFHQPLLPTNRLILCTGPWRLFDRRNRHVLPGHTQQCRPRGPPKSGRRSGRPTTSGRFEHQYTLFTSQHDTTGPTLGWPITRCIGSGLLLQFGQRSQRFGFATGPRLCRRLVKHHCCGRGLSRPYTRLFGSIAVQVHTETQQNCRNAVATRPPWPRRARAAHFPGTGARPLQG